VGLAIGGRWYDVRCGWYLYQGSTIRRSFSRKLIPAAADWWEYTGVAKLKNKSEINLSLPWASGDDGGDLWLVWLQLKSSAGICDFVTI
jgi:hypothetical protein